MDVNELRRAYVSFFGDYVREHHELSSAPLIPRDIACNPDTSTLFTGSGMQQFKPCFSKTLRPPCQRVVTVQKCIRTAEREKIGDAIHLSFFEMLGNFSFGDYGKRESIKWSWEFLTQVVGISEKRLCVTVHQSDVETYFLWRDFIGLSEDRIHQLGNEHNYWPPEREMLGPCGPCTEIFYAVNPQWARKEDSKMSSTDHFLKNITDGVHWTEIWNNVFTESIRAIDEKGILYAWPLPSMNNDTGAGLERVAMASEGLENIYEVETLAPLMAHIESLVVGGGDDSEKLKKLRAMRVIADHARAVTFSVSEGIYPSNKGAGYVIRSMIRRAAIIGKYHLSRNTLLLDTIAGTVIEIMGEAYPLLNAHRRDILQTIRTEESGFVRTMEKGIVRAKKMIEVAQLEGKSSLPGKDLFYLYDTFGFPIELTCELAELAGLDLDREGYHLEMVSQRIKSKRGKEAKL